MSLHDRPRRSLPLLTAVLLTTAFADPAAPVPVRGQAIIAGQSFELHHAWIIRGPDHFQEGKMNTFIVMAKDDISPELAKCPTVKCAIWDVLKNGLILQPEKDGSFWVRALHPKLAKEQQLSARGWTATVDEPNHIVGRLHWEPQGQDPPVLDLEIDAALLQAFPANPGSLTYSDPQGRFRFSYPPAFGQSERGTNDGFGDRVAAIRFSRFSGVSQDGQILLGGEAALTKGPVLLDLQAAGGLYDAISLEVFPAAMRASILSSLEPLTASNLCRELALEQHIDVANPSLAALTPQQKDALVRLDRVRSGSPRLVSCSAARDTVTFHKEVTAQFGQASSRQHIYGAVRFLKAPYSSFQLIQAGANAPTPDTLATMTSVVQSFEPR